MTTVREIPLRLIDDLGENVREHTDAGLVDSIRRYGVLQAITVRKVGRRYRVVMGHRRLRAASIVGLETIPALVEDVLHDDQVLRQVAENVHRRAMAPMEVARALQAYLDAHPEVGKRELGEAMGLSPRYAPAWVANKLALLRLDQKTQERVEAGELNEHVAIRQRIRRNDGRGHPRVIPLPDEDGRSRSVQVDVGRSPAGRPGRWSIGIDHVARQADVVVEIGELRLLVLLEPAELKLLGRRLTQAYEAIA